MSSYQTHLIAGISLSFLFYYFIADFLTPTTDVIFISIFFIFLGSVFPDIDHKNSKIHKMVKSFVVLFLMIIFALLSYPNTTAIVLSSSLVGLGTYSFISALKPKHRGVVHSFKFCLASSFLVGIFVYFAFQSIVPGLFFFVSYFSHLILDALT